MHFLVNNACDRVWQRALLLAALVCAPAARLRKEPWKRRATECRLSSREPKKMVEREVEDGVCTATKLQAETRKWEAAGFNDVVIHCIGLYENEHGQQD